jgi:hypothetical protein
MSLNKALYSLLLVLMQSALAYSLPIDVLYQHLQRVAPNNNQVTYGLVQHNLINKFIITPNIFGKELSVYNEGFIPKAGETMDKTYHLPTCQKQSDCQGYSVCEKEAYTNNTSLCTPSGYIWPKEVYNIIVSANKTVDLGTLSPENASQFSGVYFTPIIINALVNLAKKTIHTKRSINVRMIEGTYAPFIKPFFGNKAATKQYLLNIVKALPKGNHLNISLGEERTCFLWNKNCGSEKGIYYKATAYNHAKYIIVDNKQAIIGGHNLYDAYLNPSPPNDLSLKIEGPVVNMETTYANFIWNKLNENKSFWSYWANYCYSYDSDTQNITPSCMVHLPKVMPHKDFQPGAAILSIAKLTDIVNDGDQSEEARVYAFNHAKSSIKISQQSIYVKYLGKSFAPNSIQNEDNIIKALAQAMLRGVHVYIVVSGLNASNDYNSYVTHAYMKSSMMKELMQLGCSDDQATAIMNKYYALKEISFNINDKTDTTKSHNKFWIVDDDLYYIGSHNIYPDSEQQLGIILNTGADYILKQLWDPLWNNSHF